MEQLRFVRIALGICAFLVMAAPARADSVQVPLTFSGTGLDTVPSYLVPTPFDPALGTLDSVAVRIDVTVSGSLFVWSGLPDPVSWVMRTKVTVDQYFARFYFLTPYTVYFEGQGASGSIMPYSHSFQIDFTLDAASDPAGGVFVPPPGGWGEPPARAGGLTSGFLADPFYPVDFSLVTVEIQGAFGAVPFALQVDGAVTLTYGFTPATQPVPEPAGLAMVGIGLAGAVLLRRFRRRAA